MLNMKMENVYTGEELANVLKGIVETEQPTTIIFHEDLFGFCDDIITIKVKVDTDGYHVKANGVDWNDTKYKTFHSSYNFKDYVWALCGW